MKWAPGKLLATLDAGDLRMFRRLKAREEAISAMVERLLEASAKRQEEYAEFIRGIEQKYNLQNEDAFLLVSNGEIREAVKPDANIG